MVPVLGREVVEGEERLSVPGQAFGGTGVFRPVLLDEDIDAASAAARVGALWISRRSLFMAA